MIVSKCPGYRWMPEVASSDITYPGDSLYQRYLVPEIATRKVSCAYNVLSRKPPYPYTPYTEDRSYRR